MIYLPLKILLLHDNPPYTANTIRDHIRAITKISRHQYFCISMLGNIPSKVNLNRFDVLMIHYTLVVSHEEYLTQGSRDRIKEFTGLKLMFIQDEYRFVDKTIHAMQEMKISLLFTNFPEEEFENVYPKYKLPNLKLVNVLTGYVPDHLLNYHPPLPSQRKMLVGYRANKVPAWLGELGEEKIRIGERFKIDAFRYPDLECDISLQQSDRIYGRAWIKFLMKCRAVLGVETGASVIDFTGEIQNRVENALFENPSISFRELQNKYLKNLEYKIKLNQISPRCFEAIALKALMILYEGEYSNRLTPWKHYIPLKKDHSNMSEVVEALMDDNLCDTIANCAFKEIALDEKNTYKHFANIIDKSIETAFSDEMLSKFNGYSNLEFWLQSLPDNSTICKRLIRRRDVIINLMFNKYFPKYLSEEVVKGIKNLLRKVYKIFNFIIKKEA